MLLCTKLELPATDSAFNQMLNAVRSMDGVYVLPELTHFDTKIAYIRMRYRKNGKYRNIGAIQYNSKLNKVDIHLKYTVWYKKKIEFLKNVIECGLV